MIGIVNNSEICYQSLQSFVKSLQKGFEELGYEVEQIEVLDYACISKKWEAVIFLIAVLPK